jgi:hypothetical protein
MAVAVATGFSFRWPEISLTPPSERPGPDPVAGSTVLLCPPAQAKKIAVTSLVLSGRDSG